VRAVLLVLVVALIVAVLLPRLRHSLAGARRVSRPLDELVKDPVCQMYVVRSRAVTGRGAHGAPYFCSVDCARRYSR
jgi:YHS domain-containing protein